MKVVTEDTKDLMVIIKKDRGERLTLCEWTYICPRTSEGYDVSCCKCPLGAIEEEYTYEEALRILEDL